MQATVFSSLAKVEYFGAKIKKMMFRANLLVTLIRNLSNRLVN